MRSTNCSLPIGETALCGLHEQMVVIGHKAVGVAPPLETLDNIAKNLQKRPSILIIFVDCLASITPRRDMVIGSGKLDA